MNKQHLKNGKVVANQKSAEGFRRKALKALAARRGGRLSILAQDSDRLVHELQVHQVELEMQNDELRAAQLKLEQSSAKYASLFDFAPVGYFCLDRHGLILEANLTGARLLGMERRRMIQQRFLGFVARESRACFQKHLRLVFKGEPSPACELRLYKADNTPFSAQLESALTTDDQDHSHCCRTAMTDITVRKQAEDVLRKAHEELEQRVQQRTRELSSANRDLQTEVAQRRRAEQALKEAHEDLERRIQQRTGELSQANRVLEAEIVLRKHAEEAHRQVLRRMVETQEAERGRIARGLHDQLGQELAALSLALKRIGEELPDGSPLRPRVGQSLIIVGNLMRDAHGLVWNLRPPALDDMGLCIALRRYTAEWAKSSDIPVDFHCHGDNHKRLPAQVETTLFRIAQEALTNVLKHAQARRVSVLLEHRRRHVAMIIEDDGRGFQVEKVLDNLKNGKGHLGLIGMRERVMLAGGSVNIESTRGGGTTVFTRIPTGAEQPRAQPA